MKPTFIEIEKEQNGRRLWVRRDAVVSIAEFDHLDSNSRLRITLVDGSGFSCGMTSEEFGLLYFGKGRGETLP